MAMMLMYVKNHQPMLSHMLLICIPVADIMLLICIPVADMSLICIPVADVHY